MSFKDLLQKAYRLTDLSSNIKRIARGVPEDKVGIIGWQRTADTDLHNNSGTRCSRRLRA